MIAPRLVELRRVLKKTGSLYLHCHPTTSHYLKLLLDAVLVRILGVLLILGAPLVAQADGLPYSEKGSLHCEAAILVMADDQFKEVDTERTMTLNSDQKRMLRRLFKSPPDKLRVVSSAFNDNLEESSLYEIHSIWLRDRMVAVTYTGNYNEPSEKEFWEKATFASVADPERLIISSEAKVYRDGKDLSYPEVIRLIDELAKTPKDKLGRKIVPLRSPTELILDDPVAYLSFSLPPPNEHGIGLDLTPAELLRAFQIYGATKNVAVQATW